MIEGLKLGNLQVIARDYTKKRNYWVCQCSCGKIFSSRSDNLDISNRKVLSCKSCSYKIRSEITSSKKACVEYTCEVHGKIPYKTSSNCPVCAKEVKVAAKLKKFLDSVSAYEYEVPYAHLEYENPRSRITAICQHGEGKYTAFALSKGKGCVKCSYHLTPEQFKEKMLPVHGLKYDYSKVEYSGSFKKVEIICPSHGAFLQTPSSHFSGSGCVKCNNEKQSFDFLAKYTKHPEIGSRNGNFYIGILTSDEEKFLKIGIAQNMSKRVNAYRSEKKYSFEPVIQIKTTNLHSAQIEREILTWASTRPDLCYWPQKVFDGKSECLKYEALPFLEELLTIVLNNSKEPLKEEVKNAFGITGRDRGVLISKYLAEVAKED